MAVTLYTLHALVFPAFAFRYADKKHQVGYEVHCIILYYSLQEFSSILCTTQGAHT
jgi:hypothetical protein